MKVIVNMTARLHAYCLLIDIFAREMRTAIVLLHFTRLWARARTHHVIENVM